MKKIFLHETPSQYFFDIAFIYKMLKYRHISQLVINMQIFDWNYNGDQIFQWLDTLFWSITA